MVRQNHETETKLPAALNAEAANEELRALGAVYGHITQLMREWHVKCKTASDETMLAVADFYQTLCRDLDARMLHFQRAIVKSGVVIDASAIKDARLQLSFVMAMDAANILKGEKDVREGRTMTLEQMRRELRNPAR
jgi:hypothetical protein